MAGKFSSKIPPRDTAASPLTQARGERPFTVSFRRKLERGYRFPDLQARDLKDFQKFLDLVSELTISEVDARYKRSSDARDRIGDQQIIHYEVSQTFRIHGAYLNGMFEVVRIDPQHKVHNA
jgi:hypothetical protein